MSIYYSGNFEILGATSSDLSKVEILSSDAQVVFEEKPIEWTEDEKEQIEMIENKLIWVMQPNISKEQTISLGFMTSKLFEKWIWSQRGVAQKFSDRDRNVFINGLKEKKEFMCFTFNDGEMPLLVHNNWFRKTWQLTDNFSGEVFDYKAKMIQLIITYNSFLKEVSAKVTFYVKCLDSDDGEWTNV